MSQQDPTADYRKYPKGPNFLLIVVLFGAFILLALVAIVFLVGRRGGKMAPHNANPTPNSLVLPAPQGPALQGPEPHGTASRGSLASYQA